MASSIIKSVLKTTIPTLTTGSFGNVTLLEIPHDKDVLAIYCDGFICLPRRTSTLWTAVVYKIESNNVMLAINETLTNMDIIYR